MYKKTSYIIENIVHQQLQKHLNESNSSDIINDLYIKTMEEIQEMFPNNKELSGGYMFKDKGDYYFNISKPMIDGEYITICNFYDIEDQDDNEEFEYSFDEYKKFLKSLKSASKRVVTFNQKILEKIQEINSLKNKIRKEFDVEAFLDSEGNDYDIDNLEYKNGCLNFVQTYGGYQKSVFNESIYRIEEVKEYLILFKRDIKRRTKWLSLDPNTIDKMDDSGDYSRLNNE